MTNTKRQTSQLIEARGLNLAGTNDRELVRNLSLNLGRDQVALVGRNGVGKSTLLRVLAGVEQPDSGTIRWGGEPHFVPQEMAGVGAARIRDAIQFLLKSPVSSAEAEKAGLRTVLPAMLAAEDWSLGERRKVLLLEAKLSSPCLLLLDEPTEDLDTDGIEWLRGWLCGFGGGLVVATHDRVLLGDMRAFFSMSESGCFLLEGDVESLEKHFVRQQKEAERRYARRVNTLAQKEAESERYRLRRQRKKNVGRARELGRMTPRVRLNQKRSYAQQKQGRVAKIREARIAAYRQWAKAARRSLKVELPFEAVLPDITTSRAQPIVEMIDVTVELGARTLIERIDLGLSRDRLAILGPNATGKTSLLRTMLGELAPANGRVRCRGELVGYVDQGAAAWSSDESLAEHLFRVSRNTTLEDVADLLSKHRFPLSLAERSLGSLSPGERVRAALIAIFQRRPSVEMLVLDEPTYSLDFVGYSALTSLLRVWKGGLIVSTHDLGFLAQIGVERCLVLDGQRAKPAVCPGTSY
ncbi:MAG: ATP-binding cassette domain-containing protein [Myxococcota bacterium]